MKKILALLLIVYNISCIAQTSSRILSVAETKNTFPDSIRKRLGIGFPIRRVYTYTDKSGSYYLVLSDKFLKINDNNDSLSGAIKAIQIRKETYGLIKPWEITDAIINDSKKNIEESHIAFWTKYFQLTDTDDDGFIDPIIVYGTMASEGFINGRIKIIIFYKGQKIMIHHQNGTLDNQRNMRIDKAYYTLPLKLQKQVRASMLAMVENNHAIFPGNYEKGMAKKAVLIDENKNNY